jgi:RNA polymerase sigma factor (sigma-70 family)
MTNEVRVRTRRPRTATGAHPPLIARDVAQIALTCHQLSRLTDCCEHFTAQVALDFALPALRTRLTMSNDAVILPALAQAVLAHLAEHAAGPARPAPGTWSALTPDSVTATLAGLWADAVAPGPLEDTIAWAVAAGLDGELLCWEVITRESNRHTGLIRKEAGKLARNLPDTSVDELVGHGWKGLRIALRQYDPDLGFSFSTYACPRINGAIRDGVRAESPIPKRLTTFVRAVSAAEEKLTQSLSRTPSYAEISAYLDTGREQMHLLTRLSPSASLEELSGAWGEQSREPSCLIDTADPEAQALLAVRDSAVHAAIAALPADESRAITMLYLQQIPIGEAAASLGVDTRTLRAAKKRAMTSLAGVLAEWAPSLQAA